MSAPREIYISPKQSLRVATTDPISTDSTKYILHSEYEALLAENNRLRETILAALVANGVHKSDCAIYNEPAMPNGSCNCGAKP